MTKTLVSIVGTLALAAVVLFNTGCATTNGQRGVTVEDVVPAVKAAAFGGTFYTLKSHPNWRPGFEAAAADLRILENAEVIDFATILAIVARLPVKELESDEAVLAITSATILLSGYQGKLIELDKLQQIKPIARAIREGIELGL